MPIQLSRSDRKVLLIGAGAFVVLVAIGLILAAPDSSRSATPTTYSTNSSGAKAAFLLLREKGYKVERWEKSPEKLSDSKNKTLILADPGIFPKLEERTAMQNFIRSGGRVIATGPSAGFMLPVQMPVPNAFGGVGWDKYKALAPSAITRTAPEIMLVAESRWPIPAPGLALYGDDSHAVVVRYLYGEGEVIWWASSTPLTNAGLREANNLEFFLSCIGDPSHTQVLWDEYYHGFGETTSSSSEYSTWKWMLAQFALLGAAIVLTFSRRSGPIRPAPAEVRLSPLEFVETLGNLYEHARAAGVAVDVQYQRFIYRLTKRLGMVSTSPVEELERAARERWQFQDEQFGATLRACASARYHSDMAPGQALQLIRKLHSYATDLKLFGMKKKEKDSWRQSRSS
jgi:hypothetical protein